MLQEKTKEKQGTGKSVKGGTGESTVNDELGRM